MPGSLTRRRIALLGGDGRYLRSHRFPCPVRLFRGHRSGGNGELKRLEASLRAGGVDKVIILARWNGHSVTNKVRKLCRRLDIPVEVLP